MILDITDTFQIDFKHHHSGLVLGLMGAGKTHFAKAFIKAYQKEARGEIVVHDETKEARDYLDVFGIKLLRKTGDFKLLLQALTKELQRRSDLVRSFSGEALKEYNKKPPQILVVLDNFDDTLKSLNKDPELKAEFLELLRNLPQKGIFLLCLLRDPKLLEPEMVDLFSLKIGFYPSQEEIKDLLKLEEAPALKKYQFITEGMICHLPLEISFSPSYFQKEPSFLKLEGFDSLESLKLNLRRYILGSKGSSVEAAFIQKLNIDEALFKKLKDGHLEDFTIEDLLQLLEKTGQTIHIYIDTGKKV